MVDKIKENLETQHLKDNNSRGTICIWSFNINVTDQAVHWKICKQGIEKKNKKTQQDLP